MLEHLRVLDLTDERGLLCGRLLADHGADVVQVEPVAGSTARSAPPVAAGLAAPSLFWETYAAGKRGITVDLADAADVAVVRRLADQADVVVTSWSRDLLEGVGLDPATLRERRPSLVYVVISAFGWEGPKARYADSDLVVWAAGGPLEPHRDGDRPPLRISAPQAFLHAAADAAAGAVLAVLARARTGTGQVVDVSAQASLGVATLGRVLAHAVGDDHPEWHQAPVRRTDQSGSGAATPNSRKKWWCRDGMVELHLSMGPAAGAFTNNLFGWLRSEGAVAEPVASWDWRTVPDRIVAGELDESALDEARAAVRAFLLTKTKAEVLDAAIERRLLCMAIFDMSDLAASPHLEARGFWSEVDVAGTPTRIPGRTAQVTGADGPRVRGRAPRLGEHQEDVVRDWLGTEPQPQPEPQAEPRPEPRPATAALAGLKVLDLSWVVAGPLIGRTLADFGAEVVRVESGSRVETARLMQPFHGGVQDKEGSALFGNCNAGKLGVTLDLASEAGRQVARDLVAWADVVVESFSPGQLRKWGLDHATLAADRPDLVMLSTSIAGQDGPWSTLAGFGNVGSSLSGFQNLVGWPDALPMGPFGPYTDYVGPRLALVTLLAALEGRRRTGTGCYIDVAQVEAGVFFLSPQVAQHGYDGTVAERRGNHDAVLVPHGVYPSAAEEDRPGRDRFVAVVARSDEEWARLATAMGRTDLATRPDLATAAGRRAAEVEIDDAIGAWTAARTADEAERLMQEAGVPAHKAVSTVDYVEDAQLAARGHLVELPHPLHGTTTVEGPRYRLSATPGGPRRAAPTLGQDNEVVLRDLLGYDDARIAALHDEGALR